MPHTRLQQLGLGLKLAFLSALSGLGWSAELSETQPQPPVIPEGYDMTIARETTQTSHRETQVAAKLSAFLQAHYETGLFAGSVMVHRNGQLAIAAGYGLADRERGIPNTPDTKFRLASITKQFTAVAVLQLQERGDLDLEAPISTYLPDYPQGDRITTHHLLSHTAGIPNMTDAPDFVEWAQQQRSLPELMARFQDLPLEFNPGERYRYSNSGYVLLTQLIETISGVSYADYMRDRIFQPLSMNHSGYGPVDRVVSNFATGYQLVDTKGSERAEDINMSVPQGAGGLYSTAKDMAIWVQFLFGRKRDDAQNAVLSAKAIAAMQAQIAPVAPDKAPNLFYGYGLMTNIENGRRYVGHSGGIPGFVTELIHYPDLELTVVVLANLETSVVPAITDGLEAISTGEDYEPPRNPEIVEINPAIYDRYVGTYQLLPEMKLEIRIEDNRLVGQATGQPSFGLAPLSDTEFFARVAAAFVSFELSPDGLARQLTLKQNGQALVAPRIQ